VEDKEDVRRKDHINVVKVKNDLSRLKSVCHWVKKDEAAVYQRGRGVFDALLKTLLWLCSKMSAKLN
jgi:hypothetical protein